MFCKSHFYFFVCFCFFILNVSMSFANDEVILFVDAISDKLCNLNRDCSLSILPSDESCQNIVKNKYFMINRGEYYLNREYADNCLNSLDNLNCDAAKISIYQKENYSKISCNNAIRGLADQGETCIYHIDCQIGLHCLGGSCNVLVHACAPDEDCPIMELGEFCDEKTFCKRGLFCDQNVCVEGMNVNENCDSDHLCNDGLFCIEKSCQYGIFDQQLGEACGKNVRCANNLICDSDQKKCMPGARLDDFCDENQKCRQGLFCADSGVCQIPSKR